MIKQEIENPLQLEKFLNTKKVFFVGSQTDGTVLIAVHPRFQKQEKTISWWDTVKERVKQVKSIQVAAEPVLQVTDVQDNVYIFVPLSLPLYNNVVRSRLPGQREFATEEEMVKAFEETMLGRHNLIFFKGDSVTH